MPIDPTAEATIAAQSGMASDRVLIEVLPLDDSIRDIIIMAQNKINVC